VKAWKEGAMKRKKKEEGKEEGKGEEREGRGKECNMDAKEDQERK
jgi:hypothetical protein